MKERRDKNFRGCIIMSKKALILNLKLQAKCLLMADQSSQAVTQARSSLGTSRRTRIVLAKNDYLSQVVHLQNGGLFLKIMQ